MRVLVAAVDAGGNTPPTSAILRELVARGHEVRALAHDTQFSDLASAGVDARAWAGPRPWDPRPARPGLRSMLAWLWLASDPGYARDLRAAALLGRPDVVLVDCMIPGALRGARATGAAVAPNTRRGGARLRTGAIAPFSYDIPIFTAGMPPWRAVALLNAHQAQAVRRTLVDEEHLSMND